MYSLDMLGLYPVFLANQSKFVFLLFVFFATQLTACAFRWGTTERTLPGGYRSIAIPIFKNFTQEVGAEAYFTEAIIKEFERTKTARVAPTNVAEVILEGEILEFTNQKSNATTTDLPLGTLLATSHTINIKAIIKLRRASDRQVIWTSPFGGSRSYSAANLSASVVNSVNPQYDLSAQRQNISKIAQLLMVEAYDRMTESF